MDRSSTRRPPPSPIKNFVAPFFCQGTTVIHPSWMTFCPYLVQRKAPHTFTPIIFSHSAVSPSTNLDSLLLVSILARQLVTPTGPVYGGDIGRIVHQDIDTLGKGFKSCVQKILNWCSICDVGFHHQGDPVLLGNLKLQLAQLFLGPEKRLKFCWSLAETHLATRTTSYLGTLQASCLAMEAPKP